MFSAFVAFVDERAAILCRHHQLVAFCLQEIHPLLWDQRGCVAFTQSLRLNTLQTVGEEHRGVAETHSTGQVEVETIINNHPGFRPRMLIIVYPVVLACTFACASQFSALLV